MGTTHCFSCPGCGYNAEVSGGDDYGFSVAVTTVRCDFCKIIQDIVVSESPGDKQSYKAISELRCPICGNTIKRWTRRKCPRCNMKMNQDGEVLLWD